MKLKRLFALFVVFMLSASSALAVASPVDEWLQAYNANAALVNAQTFTKEQMIADESLNFFEFSATEQSYLVLYITPDLKAQGVFIEVYDKNVDAKGMFVAALAASDSAISLARAQEMFDQSSQTYEYEGEDRYAYALLDGWIIILGEISADGSRLYSAVREEAYMDLLSGEIGVGALEEEPADEVPAEDEAPETKPEEKTAPKKEDSKVHKI